MNKRFTLIELLVVVAVIGILLSILLPSLNRAREKGKRAVCKSNLNQVSKTITMYSLSNNGKVSLGISSSQPYQNSYFFANLVFYRDWSYWYYYTSGIIDTLEAWYCPSQKSGSFQFNNQSKNQWPPLNGSTKTRASYNHRGKFIGADHEKAPFLAKLEQQSLMSDIISSANQPNNHHVEGSNFSMLDGSVHWAPLKIFKNDLDTIGAFNVSNNAAWLRIYESFESSISN